MNHTLGTSLHSFGLPGEPSTFVSLLFDVELRRSDEIRSPARFFMMCLPNTICRKSTFPLTRSLRYSMQVWCMRRFVSPRKKMEYCESSSWFSNARTIEQISKTTGHNRMTNLAGNDDMIAVWFAASMKQSALLDCRMGWRTPRQRSGTGHILLIVKFSCLYGVTNISSLVWINWAISQWLQQPEYRNGQNMAYLRGFCNCRFK